MPQRRSRVPLERRLSAAAAAGVGAGGGFALRNRGTIPPRRAAAGNAPLTLPLLSSPESRLAAGRRELPPARRALQPLREPAVGLGRGPLALPPFVCFPRAPGAPAQGPAEGPESLSPAALRPPFALWTLACPFGPSALSHRVPPRARARAGLFRGRRDNLCAGRCGRSPRCPPACSLRPYAARPWARPFPDTVRLLCKRQPLEGPCLRSPHPVPAPPPPRPALSFCLGKCSGRSFSSHLVAHLGLWASQIF